MQKFRNILDFENSLEQLITIAKEKVIAIMCEKADRMGRVA
jgi:hypothetical protein